MNTKTLSRRSLLRLASASAGAALLMAACQPVAAPVAPAATAQPAAPAIPVVDLMLSEYAFGIPQKVPAGLVTFNIMNHGKEMHFAAATRLSKDVSLDDIKKAMDSPTPPDFMDNTQGLYGGFLTAGNAQQVTVKLTPGKYFMGCWVPAPDGQPHANKGMMNIFEVTESAGAQIAEPAADLVVTLKKDGVDFPKAISAGKHTWKVVNETGNPDASGTDIVQLAAGKTFEEVEKAANAGDFSGIGAAFGGAGSPGTTWFTVDLKPGEYFFHTSVPDSQAPPPAKDQQPKTITLPFTVK